MAGRPPNVRPAPDRTARARRIAYLLLGGGGAILLATVLFSLPRGPGLVAATALAAGALLLAALERRLRLQLAQGGDRDELVRRLETMALTDEMTGLPNRRAWEQHLRRELARARRERHPVCVALLDLDHFKAFNDRHGHAAGDRVLRVAAEAWPRALRAGDLLARHGGEEFAALLPDCGLQDAARLIDRLRRRTPSGSVSAGVASWDGYESPEALLERADSALYAAKAAGRDRVALAAPGSEDAAVA